MTPWIVEVQKPNEPWACKQECSCLGHTSYRCGHCGKGFFKVKNLSDHGEKCPECNYQVIVRRREGMGL